MINVFLNTHFVFLSFRCIMKRRGICIFPHLSTDREQLLPG